MRYALLTIAALLATVVYVHVSASNRLAEVSRRVSELELKNRTMAEEYETRIAQLKARPARPAGEPAPGGGLLADIIARATAGKEGRAAAFDHFRAAVRLDEGQERQVRGVLDDFSSARAAIFGQAQAQNRFAFDPTSLEQVNEARRLALGRLRSVLSDEQYATMVNEGYDEKLGLRVAPASR